MSRAIIAVTFLACSVVACRGDLKVRTKNSKQAVTAGPETTTSARVRFQTRSPISLTIDPTILREEGAARLTVVNVTTGRTLVKGQNVAPQKLSFFEEALDPENDAWLAPESGYDVTVRFYKRDEDEGGKEWGFAYGKNRMSLNLVGEKRIWKGNTEIEIKDFDIAGMAATQFADDVQVLDGFQGWIPPVANPTVRSGDGSSLTSGVVSIINE